MKSFYLFAAFLVVVATVYSKLVFLFCCTEFFAVLEKLFRVVQNVKIHKKERPLMRNVVFNLMRCMFTEFFLVFIRGRYTETTLVTYSTRAVAVVIFTVLVHFMLPKASINKNGAFWGAVYIFYAATCGCWWIYEMG